MTWVALDDQIFSNKKVARCDAHAKLLYIAGLVYCGNQLTDGYIHQDTLPLLAGMIAIDIANAKQSASKLCSIGLWVATDDMWHVPDYLDYNPSKDEVLHKKAVRAAAGKAGGLANAKANAKAKGKQNPNKIVPPTPSPSPLRDEGIARSLAGAPVTDFPESDPDWGAAISKLEGARIGGMSGSVLLELNALWPDFANGRRDWLDDAILVAKANNAHSPTYAIRVLAGAIRDNKRPGSVPDRAPSQSGRRHTEADLDEIFGVKA